MYQLEQPIYFYLLFAIPVMVVLFLLVLVWKKTVQKRFVDKELLKKLSPNRSLFKSILKVLVLCLAIACLSFALVNPKIGTKLETVKREGVDIVFALDVSKSMLAEDIAPNRLDKSKQLITQIINNLAGDRVGIIGYAGSAFPQVPITTDFSSAKLFLNGMNTDMVSSQGTAINQAIELSQTFYDDEGQTNRVLFIVSDGEDHGGNIAQISEEAHEKGIRIFTIGVGTVEGGPIPIKQNGVLQYYLRDKNNEQVITRLGEETLKEIAKTTNGEYIDGSNTKAVVDRVKALLGGMDKKEFEAKQFTDFKDQFQWFLAGALFLLVLDVFFLERKTAWLRKLNLFNEVKK
ncbi:Mg-chelatase subunit ChlD [Aequorivita sublithincola DSM 14238]|uniref:Mg-chelatase subunit ChlD n=1 Tax=Aequorivita sublithincola (strain DSM 14238 / LMG 21431 / ACAM 643 / 9-3) TaxID=746697 RepID=I3YUE2_AEQSU|nr:VWA domain-containing protein [Aequorivita sublithincola]AFL80610.1 Mg-chelatase subunit ChlD [Aequorivita sublithincola DSM 14238]